MLLRWNQMRAGAQSGLSRRMTFFSRAADLVTPSREPTRMSSCSMLSGPSYPTERSWYTKSAQKENQRLLREGVASPGT